MGGGQPDLFARGGAIKIKISLKHTMKQIFCTLALATALLTSCQKEQAGQGCAIAATDSTKCAIAFVNTDTLLSNYDYAKKMSESLNNKAENSRANYNEKLRVFNQELSEFQRKVQNNGFLSMERAQSEQARLQKEELKLQELNQQLSAELMQEQARVTTELRDTVSNFLQGYAKGRYSLILNNNMSNDLVLYSVPAIDITAEVVEALNARYSAAQK